jgi:hypothetical protein
MRAGKTSVLVAFVVWAGFLSVSPVQAQNLTPQQKMQYSSAAVDAAKEELDKGKQNRGRLILLSVVQAIRDIAPAARQVSQVKTIVEGYMAQRNRAWPNAPAQPSLEALAAFIKKYEADKANLGGLTQFYNYDSLPNGKRDYWKRISQMLARREAAWKTADALCASAPPPDHLLANPAHFQQLWVRDIPKFLFYVTFGPAIASQHALQRVIPEVKKDCRSRLEKCRGLKDYIIILIELRSVHENLEILGTVETALRGEKGIDLGDLSGKISSIRKEWDAERKRANELWDKDVDSNRVPPDKWKSGDSAAVLKQVRDAYSAGFPDEEIKRITLQIEGWEERWETWWEGDTLVSQYCAYVKAAVVVKPKSGDHRVFIKWFRRGKKADGSWSTLRYYANLGSYQIRPRNIDE